MAAVPDARHAQAQLLLGIARLLYARQGGNLAAVEKEARQLQSLAEAPHATRPRLGEDLAALALINLGRAEWWAARPMTLSGTWKPASHWHAGLGGPTWSSPAWPTRRRLTSSGHCQGCGTRHAGGRASAAERLDRRAGRRHRE
jgi:hypothetical protein